MADDFYTSLKEKMAARAERDFARMVEMMRVPKRKKPLSNTERHYRWLENFKLKHGMSYEEYKRKEKAGQLEPLKKPETISEASVETTEAPAENQ